MPNITAFEMLGRIKHWFAAMVAPERPKLYCHNMYYHIDIS